MNDTARGPRRRVPLDPRLFLGMGLVVVSIAGVVGLVGAADARVTVYAADGALSPGDRLETGDLVERSVALDGAEERYLTEAEVPEEGLVVTRSVADGKLVPVSAVGSVVGVRATAVVLELSSRVSAAVASGARVDVWSAAAQGQGLYAPPTVLAPEAIVLRILEEDGLVATGSGVAVEVLVARTRVARLLQAIANGDALAVVPAGLPLESR